MSPRGRNWGMSLFATELNLRVKREPRGIEHPDILVAVNMPCQRALGHNLNDLIGT